MAERQVTVMFDATTIYETDGPKKGPVFEKDHTYVFKESFAMKWVRKGVAHEVEARPSLPERTLVAKPAPEPEGQPVGEQKEAVPAASKPTQVEKGKPDPTKILGHEDLGLPKPTGDRASSRK